MYISRRGLIAIRAEKCIFSEQLFSSASRGSLGAGAKTPVSNHLARIIVDVLIRMHHSEDDYFGWADCQCRAKNQRMDRVQIARDEHVAQLR